MEIFYSFLIIFIQTFLTFLTIHFGNPGSDQNFHIVVIDLIRKNKHRFIREMRPYLFNNKMFYPQFIHWIISFFPENYVLAIGKYISVSFTLLSSSTFIWFIWKLHSTVEDYISLSNLLLFAGTAYIFTPYNYNITNAKNSGFSTRGFGLFLGQFYLYLIFFYSLSNNKIYLLLAILSVFLILLSNIFAMQFILFASPLFSIIFSSIIFLIIPFLGILLFLLLFPTIGKQYLICQLGHKKLYSKYYAERFLLTARFSIWRDLIIDFWKIMRKNFRKGFIYIYNNSLITLVLGYPFLVIVLIFITKNKFYINQVDLFPENIQSYIIGPILISFLLFFVTTFQKTRFLGEPERYIEFTTGLIATSSSIYLNKNMGLFSAVVGFSLIVIFFQIFLTYYRANLRPIKIEVNNIFTPKYLVKMKGHIQELQSELNEIRLFSNNLEITKFLMKSDWKVFRGGEYSDKIGPFHYTDIFSKNAAYVDKEMIVPVIKEFSINCLVLDIRFANNYKEILNDKELSFNETKSFGVVKLFQVCSKN